MKTMTEMGKLLSCLEEKLSVRLAKIIFANLFYYSAYFSTIHGSYYTFCYYSWVSLYYFS